METNMAERLEQAVATLNELVELAEGCGLRESAQFLAMAKLHLLIDLNEITDTEFRALCAVLEGKARKPRHSPPARASLGRNRRDGELRAMRRAWQCPQDAPSRRGGRHRAGQ
jgi:hypothetical protein